MILGDVVGELATAAATITGLRIVRHPGLRIAAPALVFGFPDTIEFDQTYGRGMDRVDLPAFLMLSRLSERAAADALWDYLSGSGDRSIKAALEAGTYTACDDVHVVRAQAQTFTSESTEYVGALFDLTIVGKGAD